MNKHSRLTLVALALFFSALMSAAANAQSAPAPDYVRPPAPKVALVGDWITYYWSGTPANWTNDAVLGVHGMGSGISVQSAIAQKPAIIYIMVGTVDAYTYYDSTFNLVSQDFESALNTAIEQAKAAGIQVILGIEPSALCSNSGELEVLDSVVASLAAKYNLPVVDYDGVFGNGYGLIVAPPTVSAPNGDTYYINANPTPAGYALMTQMPDHVCHGGYGIA